MLPLPFQPDALLKEWADTNQKILKGLDTLRDIELQDIQIGTTPKEEVYREDKVVLYRYTPVVAQPFPIPLVICYAHVNRPYMVDLQEDRSLVRNLLAQGIDLYIIDWGYAGPQERWNTLDDYINGYLDNCIDAVRERHGLDQINLLGICQGGVISLCYTSLHPEKIKNLVTMVTPVDFQVEEGLLNVWSGCYRGAQAMDVDVMVDALGNIPGDFMNFGYLMLRPFALNIRKYTDVVDIIDDPDKMRNFLRMEKWIFDSPDQAGEAFRQFIKDFYQGNKLIKGTVEIGDQRVDLRNIKQPVLNVFAEQDHLVPPPSSNVLGQYLGTNDYTMRSFPVGHIGMYVSGKVQRDLPPLIADWLKARG